MSCQSNPHYTGDAKRHHTQKHLKFRIFCSSLSYLSRMIQRYDKKNFVLAYFSYFFLKKNPKTLKMHGKYTDNSSPILTRK